MGTIKEGRELCRSLNRWISGTQAGVLDYYTVPEYTADPASDDTESEERSSN